MYRYYISVAIWLKSSCLKALQLDPWCSFLRSSCHGGAMSALCCFLMPMAIKAEYGDTAVAVVPPARAGASCSIGKVTSQATSSMVERALMPTLWSATRRSSRC